MCSHLTAYGGMGGNWITTLMANHIPRFNLALHPEYAQRHYYGGVQTLYWSELNGRLGVWYFVSVVYLQRRGAKKIGDQRIVIWCNQSNHPWYRNPSFVTKWVNQCLGFQVAIDKWGCSIIIFTQPLCGIPHFWTRFSKLLAILAKRPPSKTPMKFPTCRTQQNPIMCFISY